MVGPIGPITTLNLLPLFRRHPEALEGRQATAVKPRSVDRTTATQPPCAKKHAAC